jgi:hypothetical protein
LYYSRRQGYIEQQIDAIGLVIARILGFKDAGNYSAAQTEAANEVQKICGMNIETVLALPEEMMLSFFRSNLSLDIGKCLTGSAVLYEYAQIVSERNLGGSKDAALKRSLRLLVEAVVDEESLQTPEYYGRIDAMLASINDPKLTTSVMAQLPKIQ